MSTVHWTFLPKFSFRVNNSLALTLNLSTKNGLSELLEETKKNGSGLQNVMGMLFTLLAGT